MLGGVPTGETREARAALKTQYDAGALLRCSSVVEQQYRCNRASRRSSIAAPELLSLWLHYHGAPPNKHAAAKKLDAEAEVLGRLVAAQNETQFTKSIEAIKPAPLKAIYINGHNPLTLLHDAVSDRLHGLSDTENLAAAQTVRVLLTELAKRVKDALADHEEVTNAVNKLLAAKAAKAAEKSCKARNQWLTSSKS